MAEIGAPYRPAATARLIVALLNDALPVMRALVAENIEAANALGVERARVADLQAEIAALRVQIAGAATKETGR